jgi:Zn-dependent peptidase ImmA (M78 family)
VTQDPSSADRSEAQREESVFRALGFIGGNVDLLRGIDTAQSSETLAFYDPDRKEVIVRGTTLDVAHQVTVAHELTHVLQDQHFNLPKLQQRASDSDSGDASAF